mgnify:CR=1 FL=1
MEVRRSDGQVLTISAARCAIMGIVNLTPDSFADGGRYSDCARALSRIDEDWQISLWGEDEEAAEVAALKRAAFLQADRFYGLCG